MDFSYQLPAARGTQAEKTYYAAMVPIRVLSKLFSEDSASERSPRLNRDIQELQDYILSHPTDYVISAFAAAIIGKLRFISTLENSSLGTLEISMEAEIFILDGKIRKDALVKAFCQKPRLADETIPVVFYPFEEDPSIPKLRENFRDAAPNLPSFQVSAERDALATCTRDVIQSIPFLSKYTDMRHTTLGIYSAKLFLFSTFLHANRQIFKHSSIDEDECAFLFAFWKCVTQNMRPWQMLERKELMKVDLRRDYFATQSVILKALGLVGKAIYGKDHETLADILAGLQKVDWRKQNPAWQGRILADNGALLKTRSAAFSASAYIKEILGIQLSELETNAEILFQKKES